MTPERWSGRAVMQHRARWAPKVNAGEVTCWRCGLPILPGTPWKLGHLKDRALGGTAADGLHPEHGRCSDASGGRLAAQLGVGAHAGRTPRPAPRTVPVPPVVRRSWP